MTLSSETSRVSYNGDGSTPTFSVPFKYLAKSDIKAVHVSTLGAQTTWVLDTHYTLTAPGDTGTLTPTTTPATGEKLVIYRDPSTLQPLDLVANDAQPSESLETAFDRAVMICQRVKDLVTRAFRLTDGDTSGAALTVTPEANTVLGWDASGNLANIANATPTTPADGSVSTAKIQDDAVTAAKVADGAIDAAAKIGNDVVTFAKIQNVGTAKLLGRATAGSGDIEELAIGSGVSITGGTATLAAGTVVDRAYAEVLTVVGVTGAIPQDDTIPQSTEGDQILSASITPKTTTNRVRVTVNYWGTATTTPTVATAVFNGAANAIHAHNATAATGGPIVQVFTVFEHVPGVTSAQTYTVRVGVSGGTFYVNGASGGTRLFGGVSRATIVLEEIVA